MRLFKTAQSNQKFTIAALHPHSKRVSGTLKIKVVDTFSGSCLVSATPVFSSHIWTISGAAGQRTDDPDMCYFSAVTGLTNGNYWLETAGGLGEAVRIIDVNASTRQVRFAANVNNIYPSGSKLQSLDIAYTLPIDTVLNEERNIYLQHEYLSSSGELVSGVERAIVSNSPIGNPLNAKAIYAMWPQLQNTQKGLDNSSVETLLEAAFESVVARLASGGKTPNMFKSPDSMKEVIKYEFAQLLGLQGHDPRGTNDPNSFLETIQKLLSQKWAALENSQEFVDVTGDGSDQNQLNRYRGRRLNY